MSENEDSQESMDQDHQEQKQQETEATEQEQTKSSSRRNLGGQRRKKPDHSSLNIWIYKVLKQIHPEIGISKQGMNVINSFILDVFDRLAKEASNAVKYSKKNTMDARAIECAVRLCLPGEFAKHAQRDARVALNKYYQNTGKSGANELFDGKL